MVAALGSSFLTEIVAFGLEWWRSSREGRAAWAERRARAYSNLLTRSGVIGYIALGLHVTMEARSGLREGFNVTFGLQKPLDPLELTERLRADIQPLYEAWSEVPTGCATCMASRHRHVRLSSLLEIVEVEEGKAEAEETKRSARRS